MFAREDWTLFRNLSTLSQKAGVPVAKLRRLVLKELVDNALDNSGDVEYGKVGANKYWVQDHGPCIPGTAEDIARLFSVRRPLTSSKILRKPSRGALGNGLRVVVGAVLASGGEITVQTGSRRYVLQPLDDGTTRVVSDTPTSGEKWNRITVSFREGIPEDAADLTLAELAKAFRFGTTYKGKTSAWWYDSDSFFELLQSADTMSLEDLLVQFDGYGPGKGEKLPAAILDLATRLADCRDVSREDADKVLLAMRAGAKAVPPGKIGKVGEWAGDAYAKAVGVLHVVPGRGKVNAELPYVVEACAQPREGDDDCILAFVNGTPVVGDLRVDRLKPTHLGVWGCGLSNRIERVSAKKFTIMLNITTPYMPITTDGKEPDFRRYITDVEAVISRASRKLKSSIRRSENRGSQTDVILANLNESVEQASGGGKYRYSLRQLYYASRPHLLSAGYTQLNYNHFCAVVSSYESDHGDMPGMYRDPRGTLYHPHLRKDIPLGTLAVEEYERPPWTFNKVLYCEKEGFTHLLKSVGWPERNDCALLSSKGFASRAVRDVIDLLGETDEEITFYCVHDADASGTLIYQSLQEATVARAARKVKIVNLGLDPWEALDMGLQVEEFEVKSDRKLPVAQYVADYNESDPPDESGASNWRRWLQGRRVELNAMTSPQFLAWLDEKLAPFNKGKVVPPERVLRRQLEDEMVAAVRRQEAERILAAAGFEERVEAVVAGVRTRAASHALDAAVRTGLKANPERRWTDPVRQAAESLVAGE